MIEIVLPIIKYYGMAPQLALNLPSIRRLDYCVTLGDFTYVNLKSKVEQCVCRYPNAQITNTGTGQRSTGTGTSSGTGSPILDNSLVSSCLT